MTKLHITLTNVIVYININLVLQRVKISIWISHPNYEKTQCFLFYLWRVVFEKLRKRLLHLHSAAQLLELGPKLQQCTEH